MLVWDQQFGDFAFVDQLLDGAWCDLFPSLGDDFASACVHQIERWACAAHALWEELGCPSLALLVERVIDSVVIGIHDAFLIEAKSIEQRGDRKLPTTVDARKDEVFGVKFKVEPAAAVWDDAAGKQQFAGRMGFAFVVVKEHARGAVHLGDDHPLGPVHNERTVWCHQWHVAHEDVLFFDVLDGLRACVLIDIKHD